MCLSAPLSLASTSLPGFQANLIPTFSHRDLAPPGTSDVFSLSALSPSALAFDFALGEVTWLGVLGPS
ncbi:hypothetical protein NUU61_004888 [Penicillium alfredii]|uniref:Uncharacterized protein n=1 Tax=Penicillium alfredii TaxID=1506179 RepID=A0A9W9F8H6_9EURO|nr:uncharacterized protein NUU61_004888 [Penicillium alfredii]KAJ5095532.1 hypothetical protein NUU61_004888 [Penicillium alfredii]